MSQYVVNKSISIKAEPSKVWEALTNPEITKKYFFNCRVFSDWVAGSPIIFKGKMLFVFPIEMKGKVLKVIKERFLQYTLRNGKNADASSSFSTVTDVLTYQNGETTVAITDDVGDGAGAEKRYQRSQKGWDKILAGLKKTVEEKN